MKTFKEILVLVEAHLRETPSTQPMTGCPGICTAVRFLYKSGSISNEEHDLFDAKMDDLAPKKTFNLDGSKRSKHAAFPGFWWAPVDREARYTWIAEQLNK